jgi:hypothetical protein
VRGLRRARRVRSGALAGGVRVRGVADLAGVPRVRGREREAGAEVICAACQVDVGLCPVCATFWWRDGYGKRMGMRPTPPAPRYAGPTHWLFAADALPNFVREAVIKS